MIIGVCSDKGAPGVTTLATALTLTWPGPRLLLEADPSGGDLIFRLHPHGRGSLYREPTIQTLALAARTGSVQADLHRFAQATSLGIDVVAGQLQAESWAPVRGLWPQITAAVSAWEGTVIVDLGRLQRGHPGAELAQAADVLLLMTQPTLEGYFHVRARAQELLALVGERERSPVGVVVRAGRRHHEEVVGDVAKLLQAGGHPVTGWFADDPGGVETLLAGADTAHLRRTALMRSASDLTTRIQRAWPVPAGTATGAGPSSDAARGGHR